MNKILFAAAAVLLGACGFHLKGTDGISGTLPYPNWHIANGQSMQMPLESALHEASGKNVDASRAQMTLRIDRLSQGKDTYTITRAALINEYMLTLTVEAQALRRGEPVGRPITVAVKRIMDYSDSEILGKQEEEEIIWSEMRQDAAEQIVRRLTFLKAD